MSRIAAPFLTRVTARTLSTATGSAQKVDQAALDAAAKSAGYKIEKFTASEAITYAQYNNRQHHTMAHTVSYSTIQEENR